jgi:arylsulfatase
MAEVYAGYSSYADHEIGRLIDYLEETGQLDNTIIVTISDNGASGEGGPNGSVNENKFFNSVPDDMAENLNARQAVPGNVQSLSHRLGDGVQPPFKLFKRHTWEGGVADTRCLSWRGHQSQRRDSPSVRSLH